MPKKTLFCAVVLSVVFVVAGFSADNEYDYRNLKWGMTKDEVVSAVGDPCEVIELDAPWASQVVTKRREYNGFYYGECYVFEGSMLNEVFYLIDLKTWDFLTNDCAAKYKRPFSIKQDGRVVYVSFSNERTSAVLIKGVTYCQVELRCREELKHKKTGASPF